MHDSVSHNHVYESDWSPRLALEFRIEPLANGRITGRPGLRLGGYGCQRVQQIGAGYDADELAVAHHEHTVDLVALHEMHDLFERGILGHRPYRSGITSPTLRPLVCTYSLARRPGPIRNSIQRVRLRWVPVSVRRSRSPSVTMPTTEPPASTTGK